MGGFEEDLGSRLRALEEQNLRRRLREIESGQGAEIRWQGRAVRNFSSNDYLGLASHPALTEAAARSVREYGTGSGASRLICGSLPPHRELEAALAEFKGTERAIVFSTGYATAVGTITALVATGDIIIIDKLAHASIVDGARLSGAKLRVFAHNDLGELEEILQWTKKQRGENGRVLIVTESLFSMDGDVAPLREITELKDRYDAWLMVDEAHATGMFGTKRRGLIEAFELSGRVEVQMGTLGKALGSAGGYIAGPAVLIDYLTNRARSFVFSTAPPPAVSAASLAALRVVQSNEGENLVRKLRDHIQTFTKGAGRDAPAEGSPIFPWVIGDEAEAMSVAESLLASGFLIPAVRFPTVARGKARLRVTFSAAHRKADVNALTEAFTKFVTG